MPKDSVYFYGATKKEQNEFDTLRGKMFRVLENILKDYDDEMKEVRDPKEQWHESEEGFRRAIIIDHIIMAFLAKTKKNEQK